MEGVYNSLVAISLIMDNRLSYCVKKTIVPTSEFEKSMQQLEEILKLKNIKL